MRDYIVATASGECSVRVVREQHDKTEREATDKRNKASKRLSTRSR